MIEAYLRMMHISPMKKVSKVKIIPQVKQEIQDIEDYHFLQDMSIETHFTFTPLQVSYPKDNLWPYNVK
jgi:hypothetical protein